MEHLVAEHVEQRVQPPFLLGLFLPDEFFGQAVTQQPRARGERHRQLLRPRQPLWRRGEEAFEELRNRFGALGIDAERAAVEIARIGKLFARDDLARAVDADELEIVGDEDIVGQFPVFLDLRCLQHFVEIFADRFHLDITEDHALALDLEIRRALVAFTPAFVLNFRASFHRLDSECFQQLLQAGAPCMLRPTVPIIGGEFLEVGVEAFVHLSRRIGVWQTSRGRPVCNWRARRRSVTVA
jgi:hypothetical protein